MVRLSIDSKIILGMVVLRGRAWTQTCRAQVRGSLEPSSIYIEKDLKDST